MHDPKVWLLLPRIRGILRKLLKAEHVQIWAEDGWRLHDERRHHRWMKVHLGELHCWHVNVTSQYEVFPRFCVQLFCALRLSRQVWGVWKESFDNSPPTWFFGRSHRNVSSTRWFAWSLPLHLVHHPVNRRSSPSPQMLGLASNGIFPCAVELALKSLFSDFCFLYDSLRITLSTHSCLHFLFIPSRWFNSGISRVLCSVVGVLRRFLWSPSWWLLCSCDFAFPSA